MEFKDKSVTFLKSQKYKHISKLAESYRNEYKYFSGEDECYDKTIEKKIDKLKKSLEKKGFIFETRESNAFLL